MTLAPICLGDVPPEPNHATGAQGLRFGEPARLFLPDKNPRSWEVARSTVTWEGFLAFSRNFHLGPGKTWGLGERGVGRRVVFREVRGPCGRGQ